MHALYSRLIAGDSELRFNILKDNLGRWKPHSRTLINIWKKEAQSLQEALELLHTLPSDSSDALTDDFSDDEIPKNNLLEFSLDS
ncbi:hypothetical protein TNCV_1885761 [Trichonephila clavipes]|nr:hypothetical protein TNCV_1885761 [Trichonephila clavipes]